MNIAAKFFGIKTKEDVEAEDDVLSAYEYHRLHAPKHGPQRVRFTTTGQQRRAFERFNKTRARKANRTHRRQWMRNEAAFQTLLEQIRVIDRKVGSEELQDNAYQGIVAKYGSYDKGRARLAELVAERIA